jgi:hypothetical protein
MIFLRKNNNKIFQFSKIIQNQIKFNIFILLKIITPNFFIE